MALRVSAQSRLIISQDNALNPKELTFDSGDKCQVDSTSYSESIGYTFSLAAGAVDTEIELGSLAEVDVLYLLSKSTGVKLKLVPVGGDISTTPAMEIVALVPAIIPFKLAGIFASNPGASAAILVIGAAGN